MPGCAALGPDVDVAPPSGASAFSERKGRFERFADAIWPFPAPKAYEVAFSLTDETGSAATEDRAGLIAKLQAASMSVLRQREDRPGEAALMRRARGDLDRLRRVLRSEGYFLGEASAGYDPAGAEDGSPALRFELELGPRFRLAEHRFLLLGSEASPVAPPPDVAVALAAAPPVEAGAPAESAALLAAEDRAIAALRANGRPFAALARRDAVIDPRATTLTVASEITLGPKVVFGSVRLDGAPAVERDFLEGFFDGLADRPASLPDLAAAQRRLAETRLFRAAQVALPDDAVAGAAEDVSLTLSPVATLMAAPARSVGGGVSFNSAEGPGATVLWEHRNLMGRAETLRLEATGALALQELDAAFRKPRFLRADQALLLDVSVARETGEAFERLGLDAAAGLERRLYAGWFGSAGVILEAAELDEGDGQALSALIGAPLTLRYDGADDPLDPTAGARARLSATPWVGSLDERQVGFQIIDASGSVYRALDAGARIVFAARGRIAAVTGAEQDDVPANRRLYAGGGGSVRGYRAQFVGPFDEDGEPTGGLSAFELGAELRLRVTETFGVVPFAEAGYVGPRAFELRPNDVLPGAGLGLRYKSPVGPLRLDVATPLDRRRVDDPIQIYVSIGQAF